MSTVQEDQFGIYVQFDGDIYRPVFPRGSDYPQYRQSVSLETSLIYVGDRVRIKVTGPNVANLKTSDNSHDETWYNHGNCPTANVANASMNCWLPATNQSQVWR